MKIPWAEPLIGQAEINAVVDCMSSGWVAMGEKVEIFEKEFSRWLRSKHSIAVNSGTAALDIALKVLNVSPGDEVIVPAFTYVATVNSVLYQGAIPVFADVCEETFNIKPEDIARKITNKTKYIICIDYGGNPSNYVQIRDVISGKSIYLIEDGAPGLGAKYNKKKCCTLGDISTTSFHTAKILTTIEGGMIFTNNHEWAEKSKIIRSQGENPNKKYHHPVLGHNYRMTNVNAAIGLVQLNKIGKILKKRTDQAEYYLKSLEEVKDKIKFMKVENNSTCSWFLFPILVSKRDKVRRELEVKNIFTNVSWPRPIYTNDHIKKYYNDKCVNTEKICKNVLCLPLYYNMTEQEQNYVVESLISILKKFC